jgi:hypothetical protein
LGLTGEIARVSGGSANPALARGRLSATATGCEYRNGRFSIFTLFRRGGFRRVAGHGAGTRQ